MSEGKNCLRCGSSNIEAGVFQSTGKIYYRPQKASVLSGGVVVDAKTCLDCGHVELVVDPEKAKSLAGKS
jgi:predicted nucleic-acid-binding Zn-ribbon protein